MPASTRSCPKCGGILTVSQPAPEKMTCPHCRVILKFAAGAKRGDETAAASPPSGPAVKEAVAAQVMTAASKKVAGYELQRELARGGLGVIYLAYHPMLKHFRGIKRPQLQNELEYDVLLSRFRREIEALGAVDSKHIVRAYDAGSDDEGPYLLTEYLDGESLSSLVARHRQLPVPEACELIRQAALGLQTAHERGLVHRDIKPSNLMLARDSTLSARVVVIDWGLVKQIGADDAPANRLTKIHTEMGTPDFIAPEQIRDARTVDIRADLYSLGVTFYFLLAGRPPFYGRSDEQKLLAQAKEPFPPLTPLRNDIPKPVMDLLVKMVRKDAAARYQTPGEVASALQPFCCAESHRLLALLAPVSFENPASDTRRILEEKTQLAPRPAAPSPPPAALLPLSKRMMIQLAAAGSLFILLSACILMTAVGWIWNKKEDSKGDVSSAKGKSGEKGGSKNPFLPPPPQGPVLADGTEGLLKVMGGGGTAMIPLLFTSDGLRAIARWGGGAHAWDLVDYVQRPAAPWSIKSGYTYGNLVLSPDGRRLACDDTLSIVFYDGKTYKQEDPPISLPGSCTGMTFAPDSRVLATAERAGTKGRIRFWGAAERDVVNKPIETEDPVISLCFSPDGRFLATSHGSLANMNIVNLGDKKIYVYRYEDGRLLHQLDGHPKAVSVVAYFADGKRLFSASAYDGTLRVWNVDETDKENIGKEINRPIQAGKSATAVTNLLDVKDPEYLTAVAFWPWGRALTAQQDGGLVLWDLDTGDKKRFKSPSDQPTYATALAISPDGHHALAAYGDRKVYLFRLPPPILGKNP